MGGDYEEKVEAKVPAADDEVTVVRGLRIHRAKGHVHFHDDESGRKCYLPMAQWWSAWEKLKFPGEEWVEFVYPDAANETVLLLRTRIVGDGVHTEGSVRAAPKTFDRLYHVLETFTDKTKK